MIRKVSTFILRPVYDEKSKYLLPAKLMAEFWEAFCSKIESAKSLFLWDSDSLLQPMRIYLDHLHRNKFY